MSVSLKNIVAGAVAVFAMAACASSSSAGVIVNNDVGVNGSFGASLGGSGSASLNSANGTFKQWVGIGPFGSHTNFNVTANAQTVDLGVSSPGISSGSSNGTVNFDYDNTTPGTALSINSAALDLAGGSVIPYTINVSPLQVNTSLGNFNLALTVNGSITNFGFTSTGAGAVTGNSFVLPGIFSAMLGGTVTGQLVGVPIIGNVNLGTITTIAPSAIEFEGLVPGTVTTTDLDGVSDPFPHDMLASFQVSLGALQIEVPLNLPIDVAISQSIPNGQSGFSSLNINGDLNAVLSLSNINYELSGTVYQTLQNVPEPTSGLLALVGLTVMTGFRRRS